MDKKISQLREEFNKFMRDAGVSFKEHADGTIEVFYEDEESYYKAVEIACKVENLYQMEKR